MLNTDHELVEIIEWINNDGKPELWIKALDFIGFAGFRTSCKYIKPESITPIGKHRLVCLHEDTIAESAPENANAFLRDFGITGKDEVPGKEGFICRYYVIDRYSHRNAVDIEMLANGEHDGRMRSLGWNKNE